MSRIIALLSFLFLLSCVSPHPAPSSKFATSAAQALYEASVRIHVTCPEGRYVGSGVVISRNQIVTAKHVMECGNGSIPTKVEGRFYDNRRVNLVHQWSHKDRDVSIVIGTHWKKDGKIVESEDPFAFPRIAPVSLKPLKIDQEVCFLGGGGDYSLILKKCGPISNFSTKKETEGEIRISMLVVGGNSGGPVFDMQGNLVGIIVKRNLTDTAGYAEPIRLIADVMGFK